MSAWMKKVYRGLIKVKKNNELPGHENLFDVNTSAPEAVINVKGRKLAGKSIRR